TNVLELVVEFIQLTYGILDDLHFRESLSACAEFKFGLKIFLAVEFLEFEVNALIIIEPIYERVIVCPDRLGMWTRSRATCLPLLLKFFDSLTLVVHLLGADQLARVLKELLV